MKKKLFTFLVAFGLMIAGTASATLYNYYNEQGLNLPSVAERVEDATMCNITNYSGTEAQNIALEECMTGHYDTMLGATPTPTSSANRMYVEAPDITLYGGAIIGDTTITLDNAVDIYNNDLSMDYFGDKGYFRINPNGDNISEAGTFTGMTANSDGTFTLTGVKTALAKYPYTETSGLVRSHAIGSIVRFTNTAGFYNDLANKENDEIIDGTWDFSTYLPTVITTAPTTDDQVASKKYVDDTALSGAPDATLTVKGISELATQAEMVAGTATGGTSANLVVWNSYVSSTSATGTIPVSSLTNAYLDSSWGGSANSLATLDSNTLVVENPANATSTPTADKIVIASSTGEIADGWLSETVKTKTVISMTAGESIDGATTPVAVFVSSTDSEVYACDGNDITKLNFIGFAITSSSDGNSISVQTQGIVSGFTGLTTSSLYFVADDKTVSSTQGTYRATTGRALSGTQITVDNKPTIGVSSTAFSKDTDYTSATDAFVVIIFSGATGSGNSTHDGSINVSGITVAQEDGVHGDIGTMKTSLSTMIPAGKVWRFTWGGDVSGATVHYYPLN